MAVQTPKPRNDAYTGLLAVSFLALVGASVLMFLDADNLGSAPPALKVDVPGATPGKAGEPLRKADPGNAPAPAPMPMKMDPGMMMRNDPPAKLPNLPTTPTAVVPGTVIPAGAVEQGEKDGPPLPVKPFVPPM